ncbi:12608_t:CDS:1 [Gigaspora margarita]|uniref:12608_t:CDS:1 n=2 Tax=Gigaspora margarita TaxID=4874 RepID=A0ABN7UFD3_GIGMA|nr:putative 5-3 exonuclease [Gigaspora margarita]CAG8583009.1 12608_t:CDS:1 [Gigaspora margarita]
MGIPGFFRWLSLRYPHIVEAVKKKSRSKTDFLYLDINALFHVALRSMEKKASKSNFTSRRMLSRVFKEMDIAFNVCNPQVLVYIAMDGVAPRAKMNEQRSRRFLSREGSRITEESDTHFEDSSIKYEQSQLTVRAKNSSGFFVPVDSASISSGTEFMQAANDAIRYYIYQRLNGRLKNLQIILNDSSVAGEGEHKLFQFLTAQRNHPEYNTKYRHVVCGCDADFIMYALLTHEPNLRILRPGLKGNDVILNINRLRKHIIRDMVVQVTSDIQEDNVIDDFVCIANLLGNDFIPRIKCLGETRVDILFQAYQTYFSQVKSYITNKGKINVANFLKFFEHLKSKPDRLRRSSDIMYEEKNITEISKRANDYIKTICWVFQYYNGDCPSWRHFYPHHRSPTVQDILKHVEVANFDQTFIPDTPIRPFEQLMCILPPKCNYLVPEPFRTLFTDPQSPIYEFFPKKFKVLNNKAILPFVDETRLMQAMVPGYALLKKEETERNSINGRVHIYAGCQSSTYATLFPLCTSKGSKSALPVTSVVFGQLSYCGPMLKFIKAPVDEFNKINHNLVATAEYQLPGKLPEATNYATLNQLKSATNNLQPNMPSFSHQQKQVHTTKPYGRRIAYTS